MCRFPILKGFELLSFLFVRPATLTAFFSTGKNMKRNYQADTCYSISNQDMFRQIAFHEAGHAAAIYLCNKEKHLPTVFFQISINTLPRQNTLPVHGYPFVYDHFAAVVDGGRLIQSLPVSLIESRRYYSVAEQDDFQSAFEADIVNLMAGPLAEAKHVALRDNEQFSSKLININALRYYGGTSDLEKIYEYLDTFITASSRHEEKQAELFNQAFQFVSSPTYWQAIERLAIYILTNKGNMISCEEAITILDESGI